MNNSNIVTLYPAYICTVAPFPMPVQRINGLGTLVETDDPMWQDVTSPSVITGPAGVLPKYAEKNSTLVSLKRADPIKGYHVMRVLDGWHRFTRRVGDDTEPSYDFRHIPARTLAEEWVKTWVDSSRVVEAQSKQIGHIGIGIIKGPEPTPEELAALKQAHRNYNLHLVSVGDQVAAEGSRKFPTDSIRAVRELKLNRPWATSVTSDSISCPYCGTLCASTSISCVECNKTRIDYYTDLGMTIEDVREEGDLAVVSYMEKREKYQKKNATTAPPSPVTPSSVSIPATTPSK